jgi:hypothetical protein
VGHPYRWGNPKATCDPIISPSMQKHKAAIRRKMRLLVDSRLNRSAAPRRRRGACSGKTAGVAVSAAVFFAAGEMVALIRGAASVRRRGSRPTRSAGVPITAATISMSRPSLSSFAGVR